jgi:hypothetical protein
MAVKESEIRQRLGIGKSEIKSLREKAPSGAWEREQSNKPERLRGYIWSDLGVDWLSSQINIKSEEVVNKNFFAEGKVLRSNFINTRLVEIEVDGVKMRATCRDNKVIKPNAIVKVRLANGTAAIVAVTKKHMIKK